PRSPKPVVAEGKSSAPPSLADQKSREELEATQNVENVKEHLIAEEIKKLVEGSEIVEETVEVTSSPFRNDDDQVDPNTRLESRSDKESPEVEKIADISQPMNVIKEEEESAEDDYGLRRREKGKYVEEIRITPSLIKIRSPRIPTNLVSLDTKKLQELTKTDTLPSSFTPSSSSPKSKLFAINRLLSLFKAKSGHFICYKSFFQELQGHYGYLFKHLSAKFMPRRKFNELVKNLKDIMMEALPKMVDDRIKVATTPCRPSGIRPRDQDDPHDNDHPEGENSTKRQKISEHGMFEIGGSSSGQDYKDDDVLPNEKASQELVDEISQTVDKAKLCKVFDEMLRQQCTSRDGHRKEIIVPPYQPKPTPVIQSCQRDPKAPGLPLVNQDLLYLKKGNSGPDKIVLSLHKFPAFIFPDDDIEERTSR
ncbi:hypothetical protein Tco_1172333, partial [Tanacetum coccineum]